MFTLYGVPSSVYDGAFQKFPSRQWQHITGMDRLTTGIRSEKYVVRRYRRPANVIECTHTNLDSIAYYTLRLYCIAYCS